VNDASPLTDHQKELLLQNRIKSCSAPPRFFTLLINSVADTFIIFSDLDLDPTWRVIMDPDSDPDPALLTVSDPDPFPRNFRQLSVFAVGMFTGFYVENWVFISASFFQEARSSMIITDPDPTCQLITDPDPDWKVSDPGGSGSAALHLNQFVERRKKNVTRHLYLSVFSIMAGSLEGASGGLAGSGEELGSEWEVKSCGGSSVHSQVNQNLI